MSRFDFNKIREKAISAYKNEVDISRGIQDEVKIFNERFPKHLEPLGRLNDMIEEYESGAFTSKNVGEFSDVNGMTGDSEEEKAWSFWLSKGLGKKAVAGIMGNIYQESKFKPDNIQGNGRGPARGLYQWEHKGPNNGKRWGALISFAKDKGGSEWDSEMQHEYAYWEVTSGNHDWIWPIVNGYASVRHDVSGKGAEPLKKFGKIDDIEQTTHIFERVFFRAGDIQLQTRIKSAKEYYEKYKDWTPGESAGASGQFLPPHRSASYTVTSEYGYRIHPIYGDRRLHAGIDVSSSKHTPLYTIGPGKVVQNKYDADGWGHYVVINHGSIGGKEVYSLYAHMRQKSSLNIGQTLSGNEQVGVEATTGSSTGIHLHLEIREGGPGGNWSSAKPINPRNYITFK